MSEMRVGTRELKNKLSEYLRRVKAGDTITVTEHGKPIGQIIPIRQEIGERMKILADSGSLEWNGAKLEPYKTRSVNEGKKQLSDLITEERK